MKGLSEHETLFCRYYAETRNQREAAARAGYWMAPDRTGRALLARPEIAQEIDRLEKTRERTADGAAAGMARLAFGSVADAVRLMRRWEELDDEEIERMDLFCVSELRQLKGGGLEIRLHDRMEALRALREWGEAGAGAAAHPFYKALEQAAARGAAPGEE